VNHCFQFFQCFSAVGLVRGRVHDTNKAVPLFPKVSALEQEQEEKQANLR